MRAKLVAIALSGTCVLAACRALALPGVGVMRPDRVVKISLRMTADERATVVAAGPRTDEPWRLPDSANLFLVGAVLIGAATLLRRTKSPD